MQVKKPYNLYNIWAYILFLVVVFLMFAVVMNTMMQSSAGKLIFFLVLFLLTLGCGSMLFILSAKQTDGLSSALTPDEAVFKTETRDFLPEEKNEIFSEEKPFDVTSILPVNSPSADIYADTLLRNMAKEFNVVQAMLYLKKTGNNDMFTCNAQYACFSDSKPADFQIGVTLPGQAAKNKLIVAVSHIPENYMPVVSGLGKGAPRELIFVPCLFNDEVIAIIEFATFQTFNGIMEKKLSQLANLVAENIINLNKEN